MMTKIMPEPDSEEELLQAFRAFDEHKQGFVKVRDLRPAITNLGDKMTKAEVDAFFREADINGEGKIYYEDFVSMLFSK